MPGRIINLTIVAKRLHFIARQLFVVRNGTMLGFLWYSSRYEVFVVVIFKFDSHALPFNFLSNSYKS